MDEQFLESQRRDPDPGFAHRLRARLRGIEDDEAARGMRWQPAFAAAVALGAIAALFAFPAVRATAQNLLDLFRVRDFAVVKIDAARLEQLRAQKVDMKTLLGVDPDAMQRPEPPQWFTSIDAAAAAAGFVPTRPTSVPRGMQLDSVCVSGGTTQRITVDTKPLQSLMDAFDVHDLTIPPGIDGQTVTIRMPRAMAQRYRNERGLRTAFIQAPSPEVELPPGVDVARLGEIGLRLLGMSPAEAGRMARAIDWRSTLLVPIAAGATEFQQIDIHGHRGVYLESTKTPSADGGHDGPGRVVMWSENGHVYALAGNVYRTDLVSMAESVR